MQQCSMHDSEGDHAALSFGFVVGSGYGSAPAVQTLPGPREIVFFKTRMRRALRRIVAASQPHGLRPSAEEIAARALMMERGAIAFGITWHGLSPTQAAIVIVQGARILAGNGTAEAARLAAAAERFAAMHGLAAFSRTIAQDIARSERLAALRRHGHGPARAA